MSNNFITMRDLVNKHIESMMKDNVRLFAVNIDKDKLYELYLKNIPEKMNPIYRERTTHDCSCCRGFIKNIGNIIAIKNGKPITVWDCDVTGTGYENVLKAMSNYVKKNVQHISNIYLSNEAKHGCHHNFEIMESVGQHRWDHFFIELNKKFYEKNSVERNKKLSDMASMHFVFKRSLDELTLDSVETVLELIASNSIYKGPEWKNQLNTFLKIKKEYDKLNNNTDKIVFSWEKFAEIDPSTAKLRNTSMGTLLIDISEGKSLDAAVTAYERITAPTNYKRSKPIYSQKQLDDAQKKIQEMGLIESLPRRHATIRDLTVNDTLFVDRTVAKNMKDASNIFDELSKTTTNKTTKKFSGIEEITPDKFINDILPFTNNLELFLENNHIKNMVSLIAPVNPNAKSMFKWGNSFTWAYSGNVTDSIKENVKHAGGNVEGALRFSIQWNESGNDNVDLDAHCVEPSREEIYYSHKRSRTNGELDVDIINPSGNIAVENITWKTTDTLKAGIYKFFVRQFSGSVKNGFRAQIEINGKIYEFDYPHSMRAGEDVVVAEVKWDGNEFTIIPKLDTHITTKTIWNTDTLQFVPVSLVCYSPNFWETAETKIGHKHLFFMLKNCINDENPSGIFNEFIINELQPFRHVMEAIGNKMRVADSEEQLSGVGFAMDKRADVIIKVTGSTERLLKIKF